MSHLTTLGAVVRAISSARRVDLSAYLLHSGPVLDGLKAAAARGARVRVWLDRGTYAAPDVLARNHQAAGALRAAGAHVHWHKDVHMKAVVCDGAAYLDDRNWNAAQGDVIVRDDEPGDVRAARAAIDCRRGPARPSFWTDKRHALQAEAAMVRTARAPVDVTSEYFGTQGGVYTALLELAKRGVRCRLLIAHETDQARRNHALEQLQRAGVEVRIARACGKFAVDGRSRAWAGSANADSVKPASDQTDWGMYGGPALARRLERRFAQEWQHAREAAERETVLA